MPGGDGTGPMGMGPGTGWGRGPCVVGPRYAGGWWRGGAFGRRWPRRRYWGYGYPYPYAPFPESFPPDGGEIPLSTLREERELLAERLKEIDRHLARVDKSTEPNE